MKVLVTTPTGKVGSEVVKALSVNKVNQRLAIRDSSKAPAGLEAVRFDYRDPDSWARALNGVDRIYLASVGDQDAQPEKDFVDLAKAKGVRRIVKLGAMGIEDSDVALRQVEKHVEASGLEWTFLHPTWFYQTFSTAHVASIRQGVLAEPAGDSWTAFVDTRDVAAVAVAALTQDGHRGKIYTLTGADRVTRAQVAKALSEALGRPVRYQNLTDQEFRTAMKPYLSAAYLELLSGLYRGVREGWTQKQTDDVRQVLGRDPIGLKRFVADHAAIWT